MKVARFSKTGFILASAGSAVGLGNIWKFPYITGEYGGGAFVLVYLLTVLFIGFSIMIAEMFIGYKGRSDTVSSFEKLSPNRYKYFKLAGFQSIAGLAIMFFYAVVIGWIFDYIILSITYLPSSIQEAQTTFNSLTKKDFLKQFIYLTIAFIIVTYVVSKGIKSGIERLNDFLMPLLIFIIGGMFLYSLTLDSFSKSFEFMFKPDWSKLNSKAFLAAVGHAFFTLSLGMGAIMTYAASMPKNSNLVNSAFWVVFLDTAIALLAGLMLFTFLYQYGSGPDKGPGLVFISLPSAFYAMGALGHFFAVIFFIALAFAGLTSAVSLVEPMVLYLINRHKLTRAKASLVIGSIFYLFGIITILSGLEDYKTYLSWGGIDFFGWIDFITSSIMLPIGGFIMSIFIGYIVPKNELEAVLKPYMKYFFNIWYFSIRYIAPVALFIVMLNMIGLIKL